MQDPTPTAEIQAELETDEPVEDITVTKEQTQAKDLFDWVMLRVSLIQLWGRHNRKCRRNLALKDVDPIDPDQFQKQRRLCQCGAVTAFLEALEKRRAETPAEVAA